MSATGMPTSDFVCALLESEQGRALLQQVVVQQIQADASKNSTAATPAAPTVPPTEASVASLPKQPFETPEKAPAAENTPQTGSSEKRQHKVPSC